MSAPAPRTAEPYTDADLAGFGLRRDRLPVHVAAIMDGNGRWAVDQGRPRHEGHAAGAETADRIVEECAKLGIEQLTLYCFSRENWKRPAAEFQFLMSLLKRYAVEQRPNVTRHDLRFETIGRRDGLPADVMAEVDRTIELAKENRGMRLCLALDYGSRDEIARAARRIADEVAAGGLSPNDVTEDAVAARLDTAGWPDPDLVLRTAGEYRVSNFLLWQISYAELYVSDKPWPAFGVTDLRNALRAFASRDRRFGGLNDPPPPETVDDAGINDGAGDDGAKA
ncbi:polyprenyl diphosphate synthase [Alienimonas chondri]|uniref:Isoprenyl transferase n=1 Tax=Alienimonas chondri TaxID=2681879 RepID=A0ABX1VIV6_9PLAN|nr:polyprenyl diphosphate synthase [Alienimonas chondri]NNJ26761.1 Ditrans,polycis-undecaprenyl-diphosphate synthase ((2E,6E)-farnesyl-diphosphate specific) [Alienimonas chondri]